MKLASLREGRDGRLVVVRADLRRAASVDAIADTLQRALDDWERCAPQLEDVAAQLRDGRIEGFPVEPALLAAPLPRAFQWLDASAYVNHVELVRRARGAEMPESFWSDPLMYQGASDVMLGAHDPIVAGPPEWGLDFEAEVAVVTGDVARGADAGSAASAIRLLMLVDDVSLRGLIPAELAKGFGFVHGKPPTACSPVAVTPDELGSAWRGGRVHLPLRVLRNDTLFGAPDAGTDMTFDFPTLVAHAAATRPLSAGTIIGSGTVSNRDRACGSCCIAERRMLEQIEAGAPTTPFLQPGERVRIEMCDAAGASVFGAIDQRVEADTSGA